MRSITLASIVILAQACAGDSFKNSGGKEERPAAADIPVQSSANQELDPNAPFARSVYGVSVKASVGTELCNGVAEVLLSTNFVLQPTGMVNCILLGPMDLSEVFNGAAAPKRNDDLSQYPGYGKIVRTQNPVQPSAGAAVFNPPRPALIGPLVQDPQSYEGFVLNEKSSVQGVTKDGQSFQDTGSFFIGVHEINTSIQPVGFQGNMQFNNVIRWELKTGGFSNSPRGELALYDSMEYYYNVNPIAVPLLIIKTKLSDIIPGGGPIATLGDAIFSGVTIELTLREHQPL